VTEEVTMNQSVARSIITRGVRACLSKHAANLQRLRFHCSSAVVALQGELIKDPSGDFDQAAANNLLKEIKSVPHVKDISINLENWALSGDALVKIGKDKPGH